MQNDLDADYPQLDIQILGINGAAYTSGIESFTSGQDIPWLQDVDNNYDGISDAWASWGANLCDVVVLDGSNRKVGTFNLLNAGNYGTLRQMLVDVASAPVVPEPSSLTLLAVGAAGLFAYVWRHRRSRRGI